MKTKVFVDCFPALSHSSDLLGGISRIVRRDDGAIIAYFQKHFFRDLTTAVEFLPEPAGLVLGEPIVDNDGLREQIVYAVVDILRHIKNGKMPTEVKLGFAKKSTDKLRIVWHKSGAVTCILSKKAVAELLRLLSKIGCTVTGFDIHEIATQVNDDSETIGKAWNAYYVSSGKDEDGWTGNGSPRLCALFTLLDFLQNSENAKSSLNDTSSNTLVDEEDNDSESDDDCCDYGYDDGHEEDDDYGDIDPETEYGYGIDPATGEQYFNSEPQ